MEMQIDVYTGNPRIEFVIQQYAIGEDEGTRALNNLIKELKQERDALQVSHGVDMMSLTKQLEDLHRRIVALE